MKSAPKHHDEDKRIESLRALNILDSLPEKDFDQITFLASQICETPIALISLVDTDRQWFKSKIGLDLSETPRELAFCAHAIHQDDIFEIEDSSKDERFFDNPLAASGPVKFYAGAPLYSTDGYPVGTVCVIDSVPRKLTDQQKTSLKALSDQVTRLLELRQQVDQLRVSEKKLIFKSTAAENISEGIVLQDRTGAIVEFNPAALTVLNMSADQLTGKTSMDPLWRSVREDESEFPGSEHPAMVALRTGQKQIDVIMGVYSGTDSKCWIKINSVPLFLDGSKEPSYVVTSFADITNIKKFEDERSVLQMKLSEAAKLSALGEMAGGVSHEINNPLAIIRGKASSLRKRVQDKKIEAEIFDKELSSIESTVDRIAKIVKGLRAYSRNSEKDPLTPAVVSTVIADTLELCRDKLKMNGIEMKFENTNDSVINCRPAQISQVIMNLIGNSIDAISGLSEKWIQIRVQNNDKKQVQIYITDSGGGIPTEVARKMMQPFYTTKEIGKGTGLGLSISSSIATDHGGSLKYAENEKNTTFLLTLPQKI